MFDIYQSVFNEHGEHDENKWTDYIAGLMEEFVASDEANEVIETHGEVRWTATLVHFGLSYLGVTPVEMSVPDFSEIVFELFPRKLSTEPENAPAMIDEFRAFCTFLQQRYQLDNARAILKTLDAGAGMRLQKLMSNPANFGMAKSFFMRGAESGHDMSTQEGVDRFLLEYNAGLMNEPELAPPALPFALFGSTGGGGGPGNKDRRKKRKAQRQARKRNRR